MGNRGHRIRSDPHTAQRSSALPSRLFGFICSNWDDTYHASIAVLNAKRCSLSLNKRYEKGYLALVLWVFTQRAFCAATMRALPSALRGCPRRQDLILFACAVSRRFDSFSFAISLSMGANTVSGPIGGSTPPPE